MSLNLYVYRLDIERFCAVQGSGDKDLLSRVMADNQAQIREYDAACRERFKNYLPLADAVERIIEGTVDDQVEPLSQYEQAAAIIAATLGDLLDSSALMESSPALWEEADLVLQDYLRRSGQPESALPLIDYLLSRGPALDVPIDPVDPLGTGYLSGEEALAAKLVFDRINLPTDDEDEMEISDLRAGAIEAVRSYYGWIDEAASLGLGLFFHA
jgi:hypothetical protein